MRELTHLKEKKKKVRNNYREFLCVSKTSDTNLLMFSVITLAHNNRDLYPFNFIGNWFNMDGKIGTVYLIISVFIFIINPDKKQWEYICAVTLN